MIAGPMLRALSAFRWVAATAAGDGAGEGFGAAGAIAIKALNVACRSMAAKVSGARAIRYRRS